MKFALTLNTGYNIHHSSCDTLEHSYITYFENLGIFCIPLSNAVSNPLTFMKLLDIQGVILTGGNNVSPRLYGQKSVTEQGFSENRDRVETELLRFALERGLPVLGVCRGMQLINVFFGGSLIQDIHLREHSINHAGSSHINRIMDDDTAKILDAAEVIVNSFHRQGFTIEMAAPALKIFAISEDGLVEGLYHPKYPILAIQWHPERPSATAEFDLRLIQSFLQGIFWKGKKN